jgi:hypothetical protein
MQCSCTLVEGTLLFDDLIVILLYLKKKRNTLQNGFAPLVSKNTGFQKYCRALINCRYSNLAKFLIYVKRGRVIMPPPCSSSGKRKYLMQPNPPIRFRIFISGHSFSVIKNEIAPTDENQKVL